MNSKRVGQFFIFLLILFIFLNFSSILQYKYDEYKEERYYKRQIQQLGIVDIDNDERDYQWKKPSREYSKEEQKCLAKNVYYEARGEDVHGQLAVAQITLNRLEMGNWGNTICSVVFSKNQFSWTEDKTLRNKALVEPEAWEVSMAVSKTALLGATLYDLRDAIYFHTTQVKPVWRKSMSKIKQIGAHIFYAKND